MDFIRRTTLVAIIIIAFSVNVLAAEKHFHPKGKVPSKCTVELQNGQRKSLPFDDRRDLEEAKKGFIAALKFINEHVGGRCRLNHHHRSRRSGKDDDGCGQFR